MWTSVLVAGLFGLFLWALLNGKTSRPDGTLIANVHPYRILLGHISPRRGDAVVFFESQVRAEKLLAYLSQVKPRLDADLTHCLLAALLAALAQNPRMNRFVVGRRLYQRNHVAVTFSAKRKRLDREAKLATPKLFGQPGESFAALCARINGHLTIERSDEKTYLDRELSLLTRIPRALLGRAVALCQWLDYHNLLPAGFVRNDGLFTSVFVANLGSLGMDAAFHHLYEWGNCPVFLVAGRIAERVVVEDGVPVVRKILPLRWTYDERIDDGLNARFGMDAVVRMLEDPAHHFGCLSPDGSDEKPLLVEDSSMPGQ